MRDAKRQRTIFVEEKFYGQAAGRLFLSKLMRRRRRLLDGLNPFEQENQRDARERKQTEQIKIVHERPQVRLLVEQ